jgi:glycosyltransferase involved in cell wall biosynthesis
MKRLFFIITQSESGGAQQFLIQTLSQLKKGAYDLHVAVGRDGDGSLATALQKLQIPVSVISSLRRDIYPLSDLKAVWDIKQRIQDVQPDTLILLSSKAGFLGSLAAQLTSRKQKVVYRIGGWTFNDPWPQWKKKLWIFLERVSAPWKDIIVLNNQYDLNQAQSLNIKPRQELALVHNGIDPYRLEFLPRDEARAALFSAIPGTPTDLAKKKIIGTIANLYPTKGLVHLLDAAGSMIDPDIIWAIIGEGSERLRLENIIAERKLKNVFLLGSFAHASRYLSAFDVYVLPSIKEGFPWSVLEAMAAKLPVVATRVGAIPEIIDDGLNGYIVSPSDSAAIADRVARILTNDPAAQEMGIQAHQKVLFSFTLDAMVKAFEELL